MQSDSMDVEMGSENVRRKGRGFTARSGNEDNSKTVYDSMPADGETAASSNAQRSVEGWIIIVTGVHEEASEEDLQDKFGEFGDIKNLHLNLDRRTGYVKGYALVEYETKAEAQAAITGATGSQLLEQTLQCDYAFIKPPASAPAVKNSAAGVRNPRGRSASPERKEPLRNRID